MAKDTADGPYFPFQLSRITDQIEQHDSDRLAALDTLARLRGVSLSALMDSLGLQPPPDA
ncbi:MAG TPA: hypothetical protein VLA19_33280 [Herpetosiphonaceae bacterium]|nr:hypothetical protein [Herpetosiphonaceae bacterium]